MTADHGPPALKPPQPQEAKLSLLSEGCPTHILSHTEIQCADGSLYRLFKAVPKRSPPASGFAALYMLDGNAAFDALTPQMLAKVPGLVIIGVGYPTPLRFDRPRRSLDYTPDRNGDGPSPDPSAPERMVGGADLFMARLIGEIRSYAEAETPIDPDKRTLWGHSLAGLFTAHILLKKPGSFSAFAAISPSIWWGDEVLLRTEEKTPASDSPIVNVLIMLGDSERRSSASGPHWHGAAPHTLELIQRLEKRPNINIRHRIFEGAGHAATLSLSIASTLCFAYGK